MKRCQLLDGLKPELQTECELAGAPLACLAGIGGVLVGIVGEVAALAEGREVGVAVVVAVVVEMGDGEHHL